MRALFFLGLVVWVKPLVNMLKKASAHFGQNECWHLEHRLLALQRHSRARTTSTRIFLTTWEHCPPAFVSIQVAILPSSFNPEARSQPRASISYLGVGAAQICNTLSRVISSLTKSMHAVGCGDRRRSTHRSDEL
ncbi:uncharacterized protein LACBIDRAFT_318081 [Laccaria bicolor S238N-H82]|uniref:Secreted protein n=1 Tax=Laccaria bicolor (strain S238N-H82 / ATCC MYA-4686) TaxID=486041 RepID=B0D5X5_LACBS|nr:uncharacterized protein LACBIDRAFT_318081 [Laccaria bicolor S238N-H82]EDR09844.1 hypothetical protein LACBIDRAFT_318081 [Laccaria bicolor S238N-H82]|eukprot:XP_001879229.1 hypothetical protein LACBIDRAFT_318081 [Laccaria bicolor S238N-H82]